MLTVALSVLREKVRQRYDLEPFSTTTFVSTALVNEMINEAVESLYALMAEARSDEYMTFEETITASSGVASLSLSTLTSATFVDLRRVYWLESTNEPVELESGTIEDFYQRSEVAEGWDEYTRHYLLRDQLYWLPIPNATQTLRIVYVGMPAALSADGDTVSLQPGWDQFIVYDVCAKIAAKEESDVATWLALRDRIALDVRGQRERNKGGAKGAGRQARDRRGARTSKRRRVWPWGSP